MKSYEVEEPEDSINFSNHWMLIILITIIVFFYLYKYSNLFPLKKILNVFF